MKVGFCPVERIERDRSVGERCMTGKEQQEREGHEGTGKTSDRNIKSVGRNSCA